MLDDRAYLVRWEYSYSSWTLFTCEIEMLLHVVSTAGEFPELGGAVGRGPWGLALGTWELKGVWLEDKSINFHFYPFVSCTLQIILFIR